MMSLDDLISPDERSSRFTPLGFSTGGVMRPEDALEHHQTSIKGADLNSAVPEAVRRNFERFRLVHTYGVLLYDLFTIVDDFCGFVFEQALGHRLLEHFDGELPLADSEGTVHPLKVEWFEQVHDAMRDPAGTYYRKVWSLPTGVGKDPFRFTGGFRNLVRWARAEGLLRGQSNRHVEKALIDGRNRAAHPTGHHVVSPVDSASTIRDIAEIINHLWGVSTRGGRLYPYPKVREVLAVSWTEVDNSWSMTLAHNLFRDEDEGDTYLLVRGIFQDERLLEFATDFERTMFPTEWLWGPGSLREAVDWLEREQPSADRIDHLDLSFFVELKEGQPQLPRRPAIAAGLPQDSDSEWYLLLADYPLAAFNHVRAMIAEPEHGNDVCLDCATETLAVGNLSKVLETFEERYGPLTPAPLMGIEVPSRW
jgi:hypothetical protein